MRLACSTAFFAVSTLSSPDDLQPSYEPRHNPPQTRVCPVCKLACPLRQRPWSLPDFQDFVEPLYTPLPCLQNGILRYTLLEQRPMSLSDFQKLAKAPHNQAPKKELEALHTLEGRNAMERRYWKSVATLNPIYGADVPGSLFDPNVKVSCVCPTRTIQEQSQIQTKTLLEEGQTAGCAMAVHLDCQVLCFARMFTEVLLEFGTYTQTLQCSRRPREPVTSPLEGGNWAGCWGG